MYYNYLLSSPNINLKTKRIHIIHKIRSIYKKIIDSSLFTVRRSPHSLSLYLQIIFPTFSTLTLTDVLKK